MADQLFDVQEKEPLFPDWTGPETFPVTDFGVAMHLGRIKQIDHEIERLKQQQAAQDEWFRNRFLKLAEARDHHEGETFRTLKELGEKSCATPHGTATIRKSTTTIWPSDVEVLDWVKTQAPEVRLTLLKTKEQPDKTAIKNYLAAVGGTLPGFEVKETETLAIRKAS